MPTKRNPAKSFSLSSAVIDSDSDFESATANERKKISIKIESSCQNPQGLKAIPSSKLEKTKSVRKQSLNNERRIEEEFPQEPSDLSEGSSKLGRSAKRAAVSKISNQYLDTLPSRRTTRNASSKELNELAFALERSRTETYSPSAPPGM
jgi:hypothetical protein